MATSLLLLATALLSFVLFGASRQERRLRQQAETQRQRAEKALQLARE